jgi:error-prone DNA polymerase
LVIDMYAELKCKTNFSFLQGASQPDEIIQRAADIGLPAIAITDLSGVYALPKAYWKIKDIKQCKLICGVDLKIQEHANISLLAQNRDAYGLMCRMITKAHAGKEKGSAKLSLSELSDSLNHKAAKGLFCLPDTNSFHRSDARINFLWLKELFGERLYLPISRFKDGFDKKRTDYAMAIAESFDLPLVATNDVLFHISERKPLQDIVTAIREGVSLTDAGFRLSANAERYLKSPFEMKLLFKDMPQAIENTMLIADQCSFSLSQLKYRYPSEWIPQGYTAQTYLEELTWQGARERYKNQIPDRVKEQIEHEFELIRQMTYADYFLTIYDIVSFARSRKILCQGRGSAANSVICYCLGITAIDPVRMQLLFERFISLERKEPPDIDVDFEHERREEVIQYIYEKYGRDRAAMVSAVVTYQSRSALREVAKAFAIDVGTLSAKELSKDFQKYADASPIQGCKAQIERYCEEMTGFPRHLSIHSGGFTLSADPIIEIVPVEPARMYGRTIIQWDKYDLDYLGLLKIDVLALGMLSALKKSLDLVGMQLHEIPAEDKETYEMIQKADTVGTFQVESRAQMNMSGRLRPRTYYDLVVQVAIVRPGPIVGKMVHPYLKRRQGIEKVSYPHPKLYEILGKTLGVPLFQEQLMKIAIEIGSFTPGEADRLRRAIGAWRSSGSVQQIAEKLLQGLRAKGIPDEYALEILEHMKGFAHYGFPESHAASFALLTYASCYLKRHHPAEFACGLINSWPMGFYQPHTIIDDVKRHGVVVLPVDPNQSEWDCFIDKGRLRLGLRVTVGLSSKDADEIIKHRPYLSLADFLTRTNLRRDVLCRMAMGGAFQNLGADQRHTLWQILSYHVKNLSPQRDLFSLLPLNDESAFIFTSLNKHEAIKAEYEAYGLSVLGHPLKALREIINLPTLTIARLKQKPPKTIAKIAGLLLIRQKPPTANGVCFAAIEDETGILDLVLFSKVYEKFKEIFVYQCFFKVSGYVERDGHSVSFIVNSLEGINF